LVCDLWPDYDERQRDEILISALWSGVVPMRARLVTKPFSRDLRPEHPLWERLGYPSSSTPVPGIEGIFLQADPRTINVDIPAGRIVISAFIGNDDKGHWAAFFPGWITNGVGRFIIIEFDAVEFDPAAARTYVVENLLPGGIAELPATHAGKSGNGPITTGMPGRPSKGKQLIEDEFDRRAAADETMASLEAEAEALLAWYKTTYPKEQRPTVKTIKNNIRARYWRWARADRKT
jgi:hypothetical protein